MENNSRLLIQAHSAASLIVSLCVYFFAEDIAKAIFFGSLACNIYLRMLSFNFQGIVNTPRNNTKVLLMILSGTRMAMIAGLYALFILKFKLNLIGLAVSFILYKLVLFLVGYFFNAYNGRNSRTNS